VSTGAPTPGVAHRATGAELWLRDMDGRGLRTVTPGEAERLIAANAAYPVVSGGTWREIRLKVALPPGSLHTFHGRTATALANPGARFEHNHQACRLWKH
jgi:hypothetical protein